MEPKIAGEINNMHLKLVKVRGILCGTIMKMKMNFFGNKRANENENKGP